jgi:hypothetical protein
MAVISKPQMSPGGAAPPQVDSLYYWISQQQAQETGVSAAATGQEGSGVVGVSFSAANGGLLGNANFGVQGVNGIGSGEPLPPVAGVFGDSYDGFGVFGASRSGAIFKESDSPASFVLNSGVMGLNSATGYGVTGVSRNGYGVYATSYTNYALYALGNGKAAAVHAEGDVEIHGNLNVTGDITLPPAGMDCAEQFDVAGEQELEPGTVVVIDQEGALRESCEAYDRKVAGVVSGAGDYKPAIILGRNVSISKRTVIALVGKVYCKVDADCAPVEVGDLLTASPTPGHAMKATDSNRAFGAVIGKALRPLASGRDLVPVLVALQ